MVSLLCLKCNFVEENEEKSRHKIARPQIEDIRVGTVIEVADHFLGVDSIGQHICKGLDKKATVVIGSHIQSIFLIQRDKALISLILV